VVTVDIDGAKVVLDDEDWARLSGYRWHIMTSRSKTEYVVRYLPDGDSRLMHHDIIGRKAGLVVDHINGCGLDNRKRNLRHCTFAENRMNNKRYKNNTSGVPGVIWAKHARLWKATIKAYGKQYQLGYYKTLAEAAAARKAGEMVVHGPFRRTA
jgi:hypothetical protein